MFYKLSILASREAIEEKFALQFKYPNLYRPQAIINGLKESVLPIISEDKKSIHYSIWGLLPEEYLDDWEKYQNSYNTLNVSLRDLRSGEHPILDKKNLKRCLIIVSGFFINQVNDGQLDTYYVEIGNDEPFAIAGVYTNLEDGFFTCAPIIYASDKFKLFPKQKIMKPLIFQTKDYEQWLNPKNSLKDLKSVIKNHDVYDFKSCKVDSDIVQGGNDLFSIKSIPKFKIV